MKDHSEHGRPDTDRPDNQSADRAADRVRLIAHLRHEIVDERVLEVMARVPRELFVPESFRPNAYEDHPLPIGCDQTISQPYIIAFMTENLELTGKEKVLEIGTGSGYQTAILAELCARVISVERIPTLLQSAEALLTKLGYTNITLHQAEDTLGWEPDRPYDAIMVTAGAPSVPQALVDQLSDGGRMVIPVGDRFVQELYKITRYGDNTDIHKLGGCRFVSLIGKDAWQN
jgi:protein-L-isoaspartate(D-aspartate) O-methyltransferase